MLAVTWVGYSSLLNGVTEDELCAAKALCNLQGPSLPVECPIPKANKKRKRDPIPPLPKTPEEEEDKGEVAASTIDFARENIDKYVISCGGVLMIAVLDTYGKDLAKHKRTNGKFFFPNNNRKEFVEALFRRSRQFAMPGRVAEVEHDIASIKFYVENRLVRNPITGKSLFSYNAGHDINFLSNWFKNIGIGSKSSNLNRILSEWWEIEPWKFFSYIEKLFRSKSFTNLRSPKPPAVQEEVEC
jgi:hypothetical protein